MPVTIVIDADSGATVPKSQCSKKRYKQLARSSMLRPETSQRRIPLLQLNSRQELTPRPGSGFIHAVLEAHASYRCLRLRPDDVWLTILTQLTFYIKAHPNDFPSHFVAHKESQRLTIKTVGARSTVDYAELAHQFTRKLSDMVVDSSLVQWILPDFSTTTPNDKVVSSAVFMAPQALYKEYVGFGNSDDKGIPSITLDGDKSDWQEIYRRIHRLCDFGPETCVWAEMLRPVLRRFVAAFDADGRHDLKFWGHIVYRSQELWQQDDLAGWITAFFVWTVKGKWMPSHIVPRVVPMPPVSPPPVCSEAKVERVGRKRARTPFARVLSKWLRKITWANAKGARIPAAQASASPTSGGEAAATTPGSSTDDTVETQGSVLKIEKFGHCIYTLDGVLYPTLLVEQIPAGYSKVNVTIEDSGEIIDCLMVVGHVGYEVIPSAQVPGARYGTVVAAARWLMFEEGSHQELGPWQR